MTRVGRPYKYSESTGHRDAVAVALVLTTEIGMARGARDLGATPERGGTG